MFNRLVEPRLARIHPCTIEETINSVQKEKRIIDTLEPVFNSHRLVVDQELIRKDYELEMQHQLFYQMTRLTKARSCLKHDDLIDVLAMAVGYWTNYLGRDVFEAEQEARNERLSTELDRFMETAIGQSTSNKSWL